MADYTTNGLMCAQPFEYSKLVEQLKQNGLRPTRQRVVLAKILFGQGARHVTAEQLHHEVRQSHLRISLATVYNTLNQFAAAGMLREIMGQGSQTYFDTRTDDHYHFALPNNRGLIDFPADGISFSALPQLPDGTQIDKIEVTIHLKKSA